MLFEDIPQRVQVHFLKDCLASSLNGQYTFAFDFEGVVGAWVFEVVRKGCNKGVEPLFFREAFPECF